jgi:hypothetical protein
VRKIFRETSEGIPSHGFGGYLLDILGRDACRRLPAQTISGWTPWWTPEFEPEFSRGPPPKSLFYGSFLAENVYGGAQRGISLASERFFWESTPRGIHPEILK